MRSAISTMYRTTSSFRPTAATDASQKALPCALLSNVSGGTNAAMYWRSRKSVLGRMVGSQNNACSASMTALVLGGEREKVARVLEGLFGDPRPERVAVVGVEGFGESIGVGCSSRRGLAMVYVLDDGEES